jgi:hypothetical protein
MADLPHQWRAYAHLQNTLSAATRLSSDKWGIETALNKIIDGHFPATFEDVARVVSSGGRRERRQARLLRFHVDVAETYDPFMAADVRLNVDSLKRQAPQIDWQLFQRDSEMESGASTDPSNASTLRGRARRARQFLAQLVATDSTQSQTQSAQEARQS